MKEEKEFYTNGQLMESGFVNDYGKQGKWFFYNEDGTILKEVEYKDDVEHGLFTRYFDNGKIALQSNFKDGRYDGPGIEYYENGQVKEDWIYRNEIFFSINFWNENGEQTLIEGKGFKIAKFGTAGGDVYIQYIENGSLVKEEKIQSSIFLGFKPDNESE